MLQKVSVLYMLMSLGVSLPFLFWWSWWRAREKEHVRREEMLILLFLIEQIDTETVHSVFFGEVSGTICPSIGETRGRYENLHYLCPEYEYRVVPGGLVEPASLQTKDLHECVGEWIDQYWNHRFEDKK